MLCPDCKTALAPRMFGDLTVDVCGNCAGAWFEGDELTRLRKSSPDAAADLDSQIKPAKEHPKPPAAGLCPKCMVDLYSYRYLYTTEIQLDACPDCGGIWIQDNELAALEDAVVKAKTPDRASELAAMKAMALSQLEEEHRKTLDKIERIKMAALVMSMQMRPGLVNVYRMLKDV